MNKENIIINQVSEIISQEFIEAYMFGIGLPANILLWDALNRLNIKSELVCGQLHYTQNDDKIVVPVHFWNRVNGMIMDPTRKVKEFYCGDAKDDTYSFLPNRQRIFTLEDWIMLRTYYKCLEENSNTYWDDAPKALQEIKKKIEIKVKEILF